MTNSDPFTMQNPKPRTSIFSESRTTSSLDPSLLNDLRDLGITTSDEDELNNGDKAAESSCTWSNQPGVGINFNLMVDSLFNEEKTCGCDQRGSNNNVSQAKKSYQSRQCYSLYGGVSLYGYDTSDKTGTNFLDSNVINGDMVQMGLDENRSALLQNKLRQKNTQITDKISEAMYMFQAMLDPCETHVFIKLIENCNQSQLQLVVAQITLHAQTFLDSIFFKHGATSAMRLIKVLESSPLVSKITPILVSAFVPIMTHQVASSVVLKCFDVLNVRQNQMLYEALIKYCLELAKDVKGCLSLIASINFIRGRHRIQLLERISNYAVFLSQDPSGNYVLQRVLELDDPELTKLIYNKLKGNYVNLSKQKSASHVVEKCLMSHYGMNYVLQDFFDYDKLWQVARDRYGNYVIQKALQVVKSTDGTLHESFVKKLGRDKEKFQKGYGQNVYNMIVNSGIKLARD